MRPVIIADDEESPRGALERVVRMAFEEMKEDIQVDLVENGALLVKKLKRKNYGLVITDYQMPIIDGLEATEEIRKGDITTPIILISGRDIEEKAFEAGADSFFRCSFFFCNFSCFNLYCILIVFFKSCFPFFSRNVCSNIKFVSFFNYITELCSFSFKN